MWMYFTIFIILLVAEIIYFKVAERFGIVDKPNVRSSHEKTVLRGGGVIIPIAMLLWAILLVPMGSWEVTVDHWPFLIGLFLIAIMGFVDDIHSLPASLRLVGMMLVVGMMLGQITKEDGGIEINSFWLGALLFVIATVIFAGAVNIFNFMDGINGITAGYGLAVLIPMLVVNQYDDTFFTSNSFLWIAALGILVFAIFNFRPKGKAKCFAGDVGSLSVGFIVMFAVSKLIYVTGDVTWLVLVMVYGVDGVLTIIHRLMLHEPIGQPHRKHAYQLMANELEMSHVTVSCYYAILQLVISLGFILAIPNTWVWHWGYLIVTGCALCVAYVIFMKKYYYLHEAYLKSKQ